MKEKLQELIAQNQTDQAFIQMLKLAQGQSRSDLLVLQAKYKKLKRENRLYLASRKELSIEYNQLNDSLLQMVDEILQEKKTQTGVEETADPPPKGKWWKWLAIAGAIIAIPAGIAEFTGFQLKDLFSSKTTDSNTVTVLVHGKKGKDELVLPNRGKVKLVYGNAIVTKQITNEGEATFQQIGDVFFDSAHGVEIWFEDPEGESYRAVAPDSLYQLTRGKYISLEVELLGMDKIFGIVKDFETGDPIANTTIRVKGEETHSDAYGEFSLDIPLEKREQFIIIRAYQDGYAPWEMNNVPTTTNQEIAILLKKRKSN